MKLNLAIVFRRFGHLNPNNRRERQELKFPVSSELNWRHQACSDKPTAPRQTPVKCENFHRRVLSLCPITDMANSKQPKGHSPCWNQLKVWVYFPHLDSNWQLPGTDANTRRRPPGRLLPHNSGINVILNFLWRLFVSIIYQKKPPSSWNQCVNKCVLSVKTPGCSTLSCD